MKIAYFFIYSLLLINVCNGDTLEEWAANKVKRRQELNDEVAAKKDALEHEYNRKLKMDIAERLKVLWDLLYALEKEEPPKELLEAAKTRKEEVFYDDIIEEESQVIEEEEVVTFGVAESATDQPILYDQYVTDNERRELVKYAFLHTWQGYLQYAFGDDDLRPLSKEGSNFWGHYGCTMIDGLDTLLIMGLQEDGEYQRVREHISKINFDTDVNINMFEVTIRYLGGLLSAYELTKDQMYKEKAKLLGDKMLIAFDTPTGVPHMDINLGQEMGTTPSYNGGASVLSEFGGIQLEFKELSRVTKDPVYAQKVKKVQDAMEQATDSIPAYLKGKGLLPVNFNAHTGQFTTDHITFGAYGDSYYEYLLKQYIQSNGRESRYKVAYEKAMDGMFELLVRKTEVGKHVYIGQLRQRQFDPQMDHLVCFVPGMLILGALDKTNEKRSQHFQLAKDLMETCYETYRRYPTGLSPEITRFDDPTNGFRIHAAHYILRPETVESLFLMYRFTNDAKYKEWGWEIFKSLMKNCKTEVGFSGIKDVAAEKVEHDDAMQSFFLSETLKYIYLLFSPKNVIPLDKYVFTTEGHPLPIWK